MQYALGVHRIKQQTAVAAFPSIAFTIFFGDGLTLCYSRASPNVRKGGEGREERREEGREVVRRKGRDGRIGHGGGDQDCLVGVLFMNLKVDARRHDDGRVRVGARRCDRK